MKCFLATVFLTLCASTANAAFIVYDVNRTIGAGTVTGSITTDGTIGVLSKTNIKDWSLTLTAPNLNEGAPHTFKGKTLIGGTAASATSTELLYDLSIEGLNYFMLMSNIIPGSTTANFWCLETMNCSAGPNLSEQIGHTIPNSSVADQFQQYTATDTIVFATVAVVPVPAAVWLFGSGLLGLIGFARRKS